MEIVIKEMEMATAPDKKNIHQLTLIQKAKFCNHLFMAYHPIGEAIKMEQPCRKKERIRQ